MTRIASRAEVHTQAHALTFLFSHLYPIPLPRLLLRNHEALAALEAAVTKPGSTTPARGRGRKSSKAPSSGGGAAAGAADAEEEDTATAGAEGAAAAANGAAAAAAAGDAGAAAAAGAGGEDGGAAAGAEGADGADAAAPPGGQLVVAQGNTWRRLLNLIMQLRKVVNHPFMMPDAEPRGDGTSTLEELLDASGVSVCVLCGVCVCVKGRCWGGVSSSKRVALLLWVWPSGLCDNPPTTQ